MTFTYDLTPDEEEGIKNWVDEINAKTPAPPTTANKEIKKLVRRFLLGFSQRVTKKSHVKLDTAFDNATAATKQQIRTLLGL